MKQTSGIGFSEIYTKRLSTKKKLMQVQLTFDSIVIAFQNVG